MIEQSGQSPAQEPGPAGISVQVLSNQFPSFETLLEDICGRLEDSKQQFSLKRLRKLEETLELIEQELEELTSGQTTAGQG